MLKIRLARVGKKKKPSYRFVVSESARDMYGRALEILGHYDPFSKVIDVKKDRVLYWISKGAQPSPTVHNLLVDQNVIAGDKVVASKGKKKIGAEEEVKPVAPVAQVEPTTNGVAESEVSIETPVEEKPEVVAEPKTEEPKIESETPVEEPKVEEPKVESETPVEESKEEDKK